MRESLKTKTENTFHPLLYLQQALPEAPHEANHRDPSLFKDLYVDPTWAGNSSAGLFQVRKMICGQASPGLKLQQCVPAFKTHHTNERAALQEHPQSPLFLALKMRTRA